MAKGAEREIRRGCHVMPHQLGNQHQHQDHSLKVNARKSTKIKDVGITLFTRSLLALPFGLTCAVSIRVWKKRLSTLTPGSTASSPVDPPANGYA